MLIAVCLLIIGFLLLWKGGDLLVDSSVGLAKKYHVPEFIIGLTLVAFGTSAPELIVNVFAALDGKSGVVFGNVLGSNIANLLLILGLAGTLYKVRLDDKALLQDIWVSIAALLLVVGCLIFPFINDAFVLTRLNGVFMLACFFCYLGYLIYSGPKPESLELTSGSTVRMLLLFGVGLGGLLAGAKLAVMGITQASVSLGLSETFLSLFILAVGTSLPELFATLMSVKKGQTSLAFGNIVGSNIFNVLLVLPTSSLVFDLVFPKPLFLEIGLIALFSLAILLVFFIRKKLKLPRSMMAMYVAVYVSYILYIGLFRPL